MWQNRMVLQHLNVQKPQNLITIKLEFLKILFTKYSKLVRI